MSIAEKAGGNYYYKSNPSNIPEILTKIELSWLHNIKINRKILNLTLKHIITNSPKGYVGVKLARSVISYNRFRL